ncbi:MAG: TetR/AcrR family transcriptional regulator C-terminal domain-containing protein [Candidatus Limnocylindria bacterium]
MKVETAERRETLTRQRVLEAAVDFADREGVESLSMRRLASDLGVEAMSLYTHIRSKHDLLDGMIEVVVAEIPIPADGAGWKASMREMVLSARAVVLRHRWAPRIIETRTAPGPAMMGYLDTVMRLLRRDGFSIDLTHHALHLLGSRMLGFTQDLFDDSPDLGPEEAAAMAEALGPSFPHVAEMALAVTHDGGLGGCDDDLEFELGLDLILDGLERLRDAG